MFVKAILLLLLITLARSSRNWDVNLISLDIDIKADYIRHDLKFERIKRSEYALNGTLIIDKDLGPDCTFEARTYRSPRGNDDYKPMPFLMPKQNFIDFFNGIYRNVLMEDFHKCANTPYFTGQWEGMLKAGTYHMKMCKFNMEGWPDTMLPGYYKLVVDLIDEADNPISHVEVIGEIEITRPFGK